MSSVNNKNDRTSSNRSVNSNKKCTHIENLPTFGHHTDPTTVNIHRTQIGCSYSIIKVQVSKRLKRYILTMRALLEPEPINYADFERPSSVIYSLVFWSIPSRRHLPLNRWRRGKMVTYIC